MNLKEISADARGHKGTVWTLEGSEDLNANLVQFPSGSGVEAHVNEEVDVMMVGIDGHGTVTVDGRKHCLSAGDLVFIPKGVSRSIKGESDGLAYLSVHRQRGPMKLGGAGDRRQRGQEV